MRDCLKTMLLFLWLPFATAAAQAAPQVHEEDRPGASAEPHLPAGTPEAHAEHHRVNVGAAGVVLAVFGGEEGAQAHGGGGIFLEATAIEGWLEIELNLRLLAADGGIETPIDLLFKKPFHLNRWFHPFVGIGPAVVPSFGPRELRTHFGGASAAGAHFWVGRRLAIVAEANYNLIAHDGLLQEAGGAVGLLLGD